MGAAGPLCYVIDELQMLLWISLFDFYGRMFSQISEGKTPIGSPENN